MTFPDREAMLDIAVVEGVKWWITFDGPTTKTIQNNGGQITKSNVHAIASTYNFRRNLPADEMGLDCVVDCVNRFPRKRFPDFRSRAIEIEKSVLSLKADLATPKRKRNFRIVSGLTKLTWFTAPDNWTPFDRLAAKAVGARKPDTLERMKDYYERLDRNGFAQCAAIIADCSKGTPFEGVSGERILDKFLMGYGEADWTNAMLEQNRAFEENLPAAWRRDLLEFKSAVLESDAKKFDHRASQ